MKALVYRDGRLKLVTDAPVPVRGDDEVLIKVSCAGICNTDLEITKGYMDFHGILGHEFTGTVKESSDSGLIGRRVVGEINIYCGKCSFCMNNEHTHCPERTVLGIKNREGVFAEYVSLPLSNLHLLPDGVTDQEAVFIEPLAAAFQILRQVKVKPEDRVCLLGDGKLGLLIGQVIALTGCRLTVAGKHEEKLSIMSSMGISTVNLSDFKERDFDYVIDSTGSSSGLMTAVEIVKPLGKIILKTTVADEAQLNINQIVIKEITLIGSRCGPFEEAIDALESKKVDVMPLVSRVFSLDDGLSAFEYAMEKNVLKVIIGV